MALEVEHKMEITAMGSEAKNAKKLWLDCQQKRTKLVKRCQSLHKKEKEKKKGRGREEAEVFDLR